MQKKEVKVMAGRERPKPTAVKELEAMGLLTRVDMAAFAGYCQAYARWKEAE